MTSRKISAIIFFVIIAFGTKSHSYDFSSRGISLIEQKYNSGEISFHNYLLNKFYYIFDKDKLDPQFKFPNDAPAKCATETIIEYFQNKHLLSNEEISLIERYISPKQTFNPLAIYDSPGGKFRLTYETTGPNAVPTADGNGNGIPDFVEWVASYFDYCWAFEIDTLGYLAPPIGTGKYAISFEEMGAYGYTTVVSGQLTRIAMHRNFIGFPPNTDPEGNQKGAAKVTAAHEFKHANQIMYANWSEPSWYIELDATWMEDIAYDATNDYYNYINSSGSPFTSPGSSLDAGQGYEDCNWMLYLCEKHDNLLNKRIWLRRQSNPGENMFSNFQYVLSSFYNTSFNEAFRNYIVWNFLTNSRATTTHPGYGEASAYPLAALCRTVTTYPHSGNNCTITKYSANFIRLNPVGNSNNLYISSNGATSPHVFKVSVVTRNNSGLVQSAEIPLNADNDGNYLIPIKNDQLAYAGLCVSVVSGNTGPTFSYTVTEQSSFSAQINISSGWNLMSIPVTSGSMDFTNLFPEATSNAYYYDGAYTIGTTAILGKGFWLKFPSAQTKNIFGTPQSSVTVNVNSGWNIIGTLHVDIPAANVTSNPPGIINSLYYGYNAGYFIATTLEKGKGYWIKVSSNGTLTIPTSLQKSIDNSNSSEEQSILNSACRLIFEDASGEIRILYLSDAADYSKFELPPIPPAEIFDVRFKDDSYVKSSRGGLYEVSINTQHYPIRIKLKNSQKAYNISDLINGKFVNSQLTNAGEVVIHQIGINKLQLTEISLPTEYKLHQNYPNPFNPTTVIGYQLAVSSHIKLKIYDALGRELVTLVDEEKPAGIYEVEFDGSKLTSGVYFYRLNADKYRASKKLILIK